MSITVSGNEVAIYRLQLIVLLLEITSLVKVAGSHDRACGVDLCGGSVAKLIHGAAAVPWLAHGGEQLPGSIHVASSPPISEFLTVVGSFYAYCFPLTRVGSVEGHVRADTKEHHSDD